MAESSSYKSVAGVSRAAVIVTGAETPTGLTTARALRGLDIDIIGVTTKPASPACKSQVWHQVITVVGTASAQLDQLVRLAEKGDLPTQSILLFSQDTHVTEASLRLDSLREHFVVPLPPASIVECLMDKTRFHDWATQNALPVPQSVIVSDPEQAVKALDVLGFPCILKPLVRSPEWDARHSNRKFFTIDSKAQLDAVLASETPFALVERFVMQQWVAGGDSDVFFVLFAVAPDGQILSIQGGQKVWQWPPLGGSTALCVSCDDVELMEKAKAVVVASGLTGLASVEFKRDKASGQLLITEPTIGRNDYQSGLASVTAANPTRALVEHLLGSNMTDQPSVNPRRAVWIDEISCLRRIKSQGAGKSVLELARTLLGGGTTTLLWGARADWKPLRLLLGSLSWRRKK